MQSPIRKIHMDYQDTTIEDIVAPRPDRWVAKELICTDGTVSVVRDTFHPYTYHHCAGALGAAVLVDDLTAADTLKA
jgi:hypothetical protein